MSDLLWLVMIGVFFLGAVGLIALCDRLRGS
jgi:hypothetical protein